MEEFRRGDLVFEVIDEGPADGPVVLLWLLLRGRGRGQSALSKSFESRATHAPELLKAEVAAMEEPGALSAALNWYPAIPLNDPKDFAKATKKVTISTMHVWGDAETYVCEKGPRLCGDYVVGEYRFEILKGVSHWIVDETPDSVSDLLLDWIGAHPADRVGGRPAEV